MYISIRLTFINKSYRNGVPKSQKLTDNESTLKNQYGMQVSIFIRSISFTSRSKHPKLLNKEELRLRNGERRKKTESRKKDKQNRRRYITVHDTNDKITKLPHL